MAGRILQRCIRDIPHLHLTHIQVATKITNPLRKKAPLKVETTFTEKSETIKLRSQKRNVTPEEDVQYRRAEIVSNMKQSKAWMTHEKKMWIYDRLMNSFHVFAVIFCGLFVIAFYYEMKKKYKMYVFSQKVAADLADELGMEKVPSRVPKEKKSPGIHPIEYYYKDAPATESAE